MLALGLFAGGCGDDDETVALDGSSPDPAAIDCSDDDAGCADQSANHRCGDRLPDAEELRDPDITAANPRLATVSFPDLVENDDVELVDAQVLEVDIEVTNTSSEPVVVATYLLDAWLADPDSMAIVAAGSPGVSHAAIIEDEIPPAQSMTFTTATGIDEHGTCDGTDLPPGDYVLMAQVVEVDVDVTDGPAGKSDYTYHRVFLDVNPPCSVGPVVA